MSPFFFTNSKELRHGGKLVAGLGFPLVKEHILSAKKSFLLKEKGDQYTIDVLV